MSHSSESPDGLIREGTSSLISFIAPLPGGLKNAITDIFSVVCSINGVDHGGIYIFDWRKRHLDMVCHYNLADELLARMIKFDRGSWQVKAVLAGFNSPNDIQDIPLHAKIIYEQHGIHAIALFPLIHGDRIVGCITLASRNGDFISGFERVVVDGLALRIARTVALHLARMRLCEATETLASLPAGKNNEIDDLCKAISMATDKVIQKLENGQLKRELPYVQKKVDALLHEMDGIVHIIGGFRLFCISQVPFLGQGVLLQNDAAGVFFMDAVDEFYDALEALDMDDDKQKPAVVVFLAGKFKPLSWPVKLTDLKLKIDRLCQN